MNTYLTVLPGAVGAAKLPRISKEAQGRVAWFDYYHRHSNIAKTCRHFGISRKTFHKWKQRYKKYFLPSLESHSRRPHRFRSSKIPRETIILVKQLRTRYPYYSKYKLAVIMKRDHDVALSASTVGRIITKYHLFFRPRYQAKKKRYVSKQTIERQHLPRDYAITKPGDLVESDTKHLPFLGKKRYAFVAVDCAGKGAVIALSTTPSSIRNSELVARAQRAFPFALKA